MNLPHKVKSTKEKKIGSAELKRTHRKGRKVKMLERNVRFWMRSLKKWCEKTVEADLEELEVVQVGGEVEHILFSAPVRSSHQVLRVQPGDEERWAHHVTWKRQVLDF